MQLLNQTSYFRSPVWMKSKNSQPSTQQQSRRARLLVEISDFSYAARSTAQGGVSMREAHAFWRRPLPRNEVGICRCGQRSLEEVPDESFPQGVVGLGVFAERARPPKN